MIICNDKLDNVIYNCVCGEQSSSSFSSIRKGDPADFLLTRKLNDPSSLGRQLEIIDAMVFIEMGAELGVRS